MKRFAITLAAALALTGPALSAGSPPSPEVVQATLSQMLQDAQQREATALLRFYGAQAQGEAEKRRADEAEAKLKDSAPKPADTAPVK